jgi:electron transfer flavoprotein beta subunit
LNIAVCVKPVPDPEKYNLLKIDPETKRLVREGIPTVVNPADKNALEAALTIREQLGGTVAVISMAPLFSQERIRECLAMGADEAYIISDAAFGGADTFSTSYTLSKGLQKTGISFDLILAGNESADGATSHVPAQLGEWLGLPHISNVTEIVTDGKTAIVKKKLQSGYIEYDVELPAVIGIARGGNVPRMVSAMGVVKARNKKTQVFTKGDLDVDETMIGLAGSPTQPGRLLTPGIGRNAQVIEGDAREIAEKILSIVKKEGIPI